MEEGTFSKEEIRKQVDVGSKLEITIFEGAVFNQDRWDQSPIIDPEGYDPSETMTKKPGDTFVGYLMDYDFDKKERIYLAMGWNQQRKEPLYARGVLYFHLRVIHSLRQLKLVSREELSEVDRIGDVRSAGPRRV